MNLAALIVTGDPALADGLLRLAAAADAHAEVAYGADEARPAWTWPSLILVGADLAEDVAAAGLQRRPGVVLVTGGETPDAYRLAVEAGAQDVVALPDHEDWLIDAFAAACEPEGGWATALCVVGARGGAGASVLATALGLCAAGTGLRTLLVDADPFGGGIDLLLGLESHEGVRWHDLAERRGRLSSATLRETLPGTGDLSVLSWRRGEPEPVSEEAVRSLFDAAARGFDLVIADVPRHPGDLGRAALRAAAATFLLVPAEVRATVAADGLAAALRRDTADLRLVVQGPAPGGITPDAVASVLGLPLAGSFDRDRRLPTAIDSGDLGRACRRGPLADFCATVLADLALQPYAYREAA
ncbi:secretion/DNA translocation related CpaE-like protein [Actinomadura coerulea]|uniref:Secretion/DNA translocation related CpaE-like protein n=1 Tax=Actinomadura coerulea TaxID=46159 RepID=A0A7X0L1Q2_9ACTN|nr:septum site-determining protein Ssd [Actinomadura coerulea]MBB6398434.1 secretion/DNA translocation related CpaE-like protein [Actinomadura coerulea]GGQ09797.1 septum formation initiator [Actinomadura coerulea]